MFNKLLSLEGVYVGVHLDMKGVKYKRIRTWLIRVHINIVLFTWIYQYVFIDIASPTQYTSLPIVFLVFNFTRVSIRKTFAQFLRNETQIFSFFAHQFCAKIQQFAQSFAKLPYSAFAKLKFCTIPQLEFCAIHQFPKNRTVGDGVCFLEFNSGKILFWSLK